MWRWFTEDVLDCVKSLDTVKREGMTVDEFIAVAKCNGGVMDIIVRGDEPATVFCIDTFRSHVQLACSVDTHFLIAAFDRQALGQTGTGHFSPIGGYHAERDLVLILDVARFKYPPYWVPLAKLFTAFRTIDPVSNRARGYMTVGKSTSPPLSALMRIRNPSKIVTDLRMIASFIEEYVNRSPRPQVRELFGSLQALGASVWDVFSLLGSGYELTCEHFAHYSSVLEQLRSMELASSVAGGSPTPEPQAESSAVVRSRDGCEVVVRPSDLLNMLLLSFPMQCGLLTAQAQERLATLKARMLERVHGAIPSPLADEIDSLTFKLQTLCKISCRHEACSEVCTECCC